MSEMDQRMGREASGPSAAFINQCARSAKPIGRPRKTSLGTPIPGLTNSGGLRQEIIHVNPDDEETRRLVSGGRRSNQALPIHSVSVKAAVPAAVVKRPARVRFKRRVRVNVDYASSSSSSSSGHEDSEGSAASSDNCDQTGHYYPTEKAPGSQRVKDMPLVKTKKQSASTTSVAGAVGHESETSLTSPACQHTGINSLTGDETCDTSPMRFEEKLEPPN
ncbi:unnamed protein product [Protopolystoma xenopodis]|uniref:Uncharacterized protein n=1 Tax=Protopolystoma xenopodis TaxID=117903 RepID=A0A3S5CMV6_9PLAT|nr:unnamed protein product [Protopolystoma xenopodis]